MSHLTNVYIYAFAHENMKHKPKVLLQTTQTNKNNTHLNPITTQTTLPIFTQ